MKRPAQYPTIGQLGIAVSVGCMFGLAARSWMVTGGSIALLIGAALLGRNL